MVDYQTKQKRNNKLMYDVAQAAEQMPSFRSQRFGSLAIIFSILLSLLSREKAIPRNRGFSENMMMATKESSSSAASEARSGERTRARII